MTMKHALSILILASLTGCATLLNQGVIDPADLAAACADVNTICANAAALNDPNVQQFCGIVGPLCAATVSTTTTTLPAA